MRCRWRTLARAETCREKQEHFLTHPVLSLDDVVTADESLREQFCGSVTPRGPTGLHTTTDLPREGCGIAAALFVGSLFPWMAPAAKRFPDAAKHFMVAQSLWLL